VSIPPADTTIKHHKNDTHSECILIIVIVHTTHTGGSVGRLPHGVWRCNTTPAKALWHPRPLLVHWLGTLGLLVQKIDIVPRLVVTVVATGCQSVIQRSLALQRVVALGGTLAGRLLL
jgi:hypothetical protein